MRFIENGPSIPDELLVARDEGRVVFFCGAGVSRAKANLDDFVGLASKVVDALRVSKQSKVVPVLESMAEPKFSGLVSADRVFGLLEREFESRHIEEAVAKSLKPKSDVDLTAHKVLLDLAKVPTGETRLVTTNFELLFEESNQELVVYTPSSLPDVSRLNGLDGIVHLHGRVSKDYLGADSDGFVLTSSDFGEAYLADGWATKFFRAILDKYIVVFVGYTADDPPVNYLLEGLSRSDMNKNNMYAFQEGSADYAHGLWMHKGVTAIPYSDNCEHKLLWDTLGAWSLRANDPDAWFEDKFTMANAGPKNLSPHQRGQIAHIVSTYDGADRLAKRTNPIPAEWLCVFDSSIRCKKPLSDYDFLMENKKIAPLELYGLDGETYSSVGSGHQNTKKMPEDWSAFTPTIDDLKDVSLDSSRTIFERQVSHPSQIYPRLARLSQWIINISDQPISAWWAAGKLPLLSYINRGIANRLDNENVQIASAVREAWSILFESENILEVSGGSGWFELCTSVKRHGWNDSFVRQLVMLTKPKIKCQRPSAQPNHEDSNSWYQLVDVQIIFSYFPDFLESLYMESEYLLKVSRGLRRNIELYTSLVEQFYGYSPKHYSLDIFTILDSHDTHEGIDALIRIYVEVFSELLDIDKDSLKLEVKDWMDKDYIFPKIKLWLLSHKELFTSSEFSSEILLISREKFWDDEIRSHLLKLLQLRWQDFNVDARKSVERMLVQGPVTSHWDRAEDVKKSVQEWMILERITWLKENGVDFESFSYEEKSTKLKDTVTEWQEDSWKNTDSGTVSMLTSIDIDNNYDFLIGLAPEAIIVKARENSGHEVHSIKKPFSGLCEENPKLAFLALERIPISEGFPVAEWQVFLSRGNRKEDSFNFINLIAQKVLKFKRENLKEIFSVLIYWFKDISDILYRESQSLHECLFEVLLSSLAECRVIGATSIVTNSRSKDWFMMALNSPSGQIAKILISVLDYEKKEKCAAKYEKYLKRIDVLLSPLDEVSSLVLVIIGNSINFLYGYYQEWAVQNILPYFLKEDSDAIWAGFYMSNFPDRELFMELKPCFQKQVVDQGDMKALLFLSKVYVHGWSLDIQDGEKFFSDEEFRESLLVGSDRYRMAVIKCLEKIISSDGRFDFNYFFYDVWPKQRVANGDRVSAELADLAILSLGRIDGLVDVIVPLLTQTGEADFTLSSVRRAQDNIYPEYSDKILSVLFAVLSDDAAKWPYGIAGTLEKIDASDENIKSDSRFIELMRRWNARK